MPKGFIPDIEYAIAALGLSNTQIAVIVKDVTGTIVNPTSANFLHPLDGPQLKAVWERLSEHPNWRRPSSGL